MVAAVHKADKGPYRGRLSHSLSALFITLWTQTSLYVCLLSIPFQRIVPRLRDSPRKHAFCVTHLICSMFGISPPVHREVALSPPRYTSHLISPPCIFSPFISRVFFFTYKSHFSFRALSSSITPSPPRFSAPLLSSPLLSNNQCNLAGPASMQL